ncbi:uncharacterized protein LOC143213592 [Lasioglossum baleicum]|uniref:uncharacterized protein LOC143213592 n=1 Tax=Lasioglossum baleicum TaxID=434251 RepID=UPI003FCE5DDC
MDQLEICRAGSEDRRAMPAATSELTRDRAETKMAKGTKDTSFFLTGCYTRQQVHVLIFITNRTLPFSHACLIRYHREISSGGLQYYVQSDSRNKRMDIYVFYSIYCTRPLSIIMDL